MRVANYTQYITSISILIMAGVIISFLNQLTEKEKQNTLLLTDYELIKQKLNGLDIISKTGVGHAILVTSHHNSQEIRGQATNLGVKILPKELAFTVAVLLT